MWCELLENGGSEAVWTATSEALVPVWFVRNSDEAVRYCAVLDAASIPAVVGERVVRGGASPEGALTVLPILVPEESHEQASEVIVHLEMTGADTPGDDPLDDDCDDDDGDDDDLDDDPDDDDDPLPDDDDFDDNDDDDD